MDLLRTLCLGLCLSAAACTTLEELPPSFGESAPMVSTDYVIGPLDTLSVFVWRNPDISTTATVRPDGRITLPLVEDVEASGKTSTQLAREIEAALARYVREPHVTVTVGGFNGPFSEQVRIVGEAATPSAIPYRANMTVLDAMIAVGGLTAFADGDGTTLVRQVDGEPKRYRLRLERLLRDGDVAANVALRPGDVIIIPQSWF